MTILKESDISSENFAPKKRNTSKKKNGKFENPPEKNPLEETPSVEEPEKQPTESTEKQSVKDDLVCDENEVIDEEERMRRRLYKARIETICENIVHEICDNFFKTVNQLEEEEVAENTPNDQNNEEEEEVTSKYRGKEPNDSDTDSSQIINRGTGAGGANTNATGKEFEKATDNSMFLLEQGFEKLDIVDKTCKSKTKPKYICGMSKKYESKEIFFVCQQAFKQFMKQKYNIEVCRFPDEAYVIEYPDGKKCLKVIEMKNQNREGSVIDKLLCGPSYKREYELSLDDTWDVDYSLCVSSFLQKQLSSKKKKFRLWNQIFKENDIQIFFGNEKNYINKINKWIGII